MKFLDPGPLGAALFCGIRKSPSGNRGGLTIEAIAILEDEEL